MALPGRDLLNLLAQVAQDPLQAARNNDTIQRFDHSALGDRFAQHGDWLMGGPDGMSLMDALLFAPKAALGTAGLVMEGGQTAGKIGTGAILGGIGDAAKPIGPDENVGLRELLVRNMARAVAQQLHLDRPAEAASRGFSDTQGGGGDVLATALAANEAAAGQNKYLTGGLNMALDPTNLLPGPETLLFDGIKAARGAKIAEQLLKDVPEAGARGAAEEAARLAANPPPLSIPAPPGRGSIDDLRNALWDAVDNAANPRDAQLQSGLRQAVDEAAQTPGAVPLRSWEDPGLKGNVPFDELLSGVGTKRHGRGLGPARPAAWDAPLLEGLDNAPLPTAPTKATDSLVEALTGPATPAANYEDFLQLARGVDGELPTASSPFWQRIGADPATVRGFFDRATAENLMGPTASGLHAVKPGAFSRFVPTSEQRQLEAWVGATYGDKAKFAWPNLLAKIGAELTPDGLMVGDRNVAEPVLRYLADRGEVTTRKEADTLFARLVDEITPAADEALGAGEQAVADVGRPLGSAVTPEAAATVVDPIAAKVATLETRLRDLGRQGSGVSLNALDATKGHLRLLQDRIANPRTPHPLADITREEALKQEVAKFEGFLQSGKNALGEPIGPEYRSYWEDHLAGLRDELGQLQAIDRPGSYIGVFDVRKAGKGYQLIHADTGTPLGQTFRLKREADDALFRLQNAYRDSDEVQRLLGYRASDPTSEAAQEAVQRALAPPTTGAGDIAAGGGGGMGIAAYPNMPHGVWTTMFGTGAGGIAGAGLGATAGFAQADGGLGDRLQAAKEGATTGAIVGAGIGGLGGATIGRNTTPEAARMLIQKANAAGVEGTKAAFTGARTQKTSLKGLASYWSGQVVRHPKNIFNDELWADLVTGALTPHSREYIQDVRTSLVQRMNLKDDYARLSSPVRSLLDTFGKSGTIPDLGLPLAKSVEDKGLSIGQEIGYSTALSAINPQGFAQNVAGLVAGGPVKGAANTWWRPFFNSVNGTLNQTFREAALVGEASKFAAQGRQALIDSGEAAFKALPEDGLISAADVEKMLGFKEAKVWQSVQDNALDLAQQRVKFLFGNFGQKSFIERKLGTVVPFASWAIRAYPVALEMAAEHPLIALGLFRATQALSEGAGQDGRPGYTAGMIPIPDKAGLLTGGQGNTSYLDLIGGISPVGGEMFAPVDKGKEPQNTYQEVSQGLQKLGLPGPNPLVQSLAYIMGFDYKSPPTLSRTQGMENALGLLPGNPDLPDIGGGALRLARSKVSPLVAGTDIGALLGAQADTNPSQYDPIARRFDELVVARTGKRLDDPANKAYLLDLAFGRGDLYAQAERETLLGGAARNIASMSSPVGVATQTEDNRRVRAATDKVPVSYQDLAVLPQGTAARRQAEQARKAGLAADPWAEPYGVGSRQEANDNVLQMILDRYRMAGIRPTQAGIQEQLRLLNDRVERERITPP